MASLQGVPTTPMQKTHLWTLDATVDKFGTDEVLNHLLQSLGLTKDSVVKDMKKNKLEKIIQNHPYSIWRGENGRWYTYIIQDDGTRKQLAKSTEKKLHEALYKHYTSNGSESATDIMTLEKLFPEWLDYKRLHGASSTYLNRLKSDWNNHYAGTDIVKAPIVELTKLQLDIWAHELIQKVNNSKQQFYNISVIMRQSLDYAVDAGKISENPFKKVNIDSRQVFLPAKKKPNETQVFNKKEVEDIYTYAWDDFKRGRCNVHKLTPLAVMFQFQTGVRIGELCALRYDDIEGNEIFVQRMYRYEEKEVVEFTKCHNEGRYVILTPTARKLIETAKQYQQEHGLPDDGYIFSVNEAPLSYYAVRHLYTRCCTELDIIDKSSHKSRKTYISALIDGGVNINLIREMVGHADERTTFNCYCFDRSTEEERVTLIENALS